MPLRSAWLRTLVGGAATYVPVTFVIGVFERLAVQPAVVPTLAVCFGAGGSVGVAAASILEYQTLRDLGALPMLAVGLIEESVKLGVPLWLLLRGRVRAPGGGLLVGVAAGMGFAALETMGYGLVALIQSGGRIGHAEEVLLIRGLLSPVGHAAWTGLVCAALWRTYAGDRRPRDWSPVVAAFAAAVALHALWDSTDGTFTRLAIGSLSGALLAAQIRRLQAQRGAAVN